MPYISAEERPSIDKRVEELAQQIASVLSLEKNNDVDISVHYRRAFLAISRVIVQLEAGKRVPDASDRVRGLAIEVFGKRRERGAWLGRLNYALTRLIQAVPEKMVEGGAWKEAFRYWVYAQTVGAIARAAAEIGSAGGDDWVTDGLVGVLTDVKDEYKRRVNSAYETVQIRKAGDCYTTRYRTELMEVKDTAGRVLGYSEVMKDFGPKRAAPGLR
jgi:hypothetical protein